MIWRNLTCGAVALLATTAFAWADPVAQVVRLSGQAAVIRDNATAPLQLGALLENGDRLTTDATGRVRLQLIDGSVINLGSQSEFAIDEVVSAGPGTPREIELDLQSGALRAHAAPATPQSRFEIRTPKAITAVRGTEWGILAGPAQSDVLVLSGRVGVRKNEISGKSAISLTRTLGVTVTDAGLGQSSRWPQNEVDALLAATDVPGEDRPFDLKDGPALDLTPLPPKASPDNPGNDKKHSKPCLDPGSKNCRGDGNGGRDSEHSSDHTKDHEHDSNGGSSF